MRKFIVPLLLLNIGTLYAGENSLVTKIHSIEARANGSHAIYLRSDIPDQNCTNIDRAIITESEYGSKTLIQLAITALEKDLPIQIYVEGCSMINPGISPLSAPTIKKIRLSQRY